MTAAESPPSIRPAARPRGRKRRATALTVVLVALSAVAGAASGYFLRLDLPDVRALEDYSPPVMTRVLDRHGAELETFAEEKRILIGSADIPQTFHDALLAAEDSNFYRHTGIDLKGIARAVLSDIRTMSKEQGASTLTQQLARSLFLTRKKTIRRKLQEAMLALEIERQYTKQEILRFYCNHMYWGHSRYGLEAAAKHYYGKHARELTLAESAMLAATLQRPSVVTPRRNVDAAVRRRDYVLTRMVAEGYVTAEQADAARGAPPALHEAGDAGRPAPHFVEEVRRWLQERHGSDALYGAGLRVETTLDPELQAIAVRTVREGLREVDRRQGWRGAATRVPEGEDPASWSPDSWDGDAPEAGGVIEGVVTDVARRSIELRLADGGASLDPAAVEWTGETDLRQLASTGDVLQLLVTAVDEDGAPSLELEQTPAVEGALVAIDPVSGAVRALVGGRNFEASEFNRAIQARRQPGSAFKPFVYLAALDRGWTLADTVIDEPTVFLDPRKPEPYQPENYTNRYYGRVTLRDALERSANIATVKLLDRVGYRPVIDVARRVGLTGRLRPFPSLGLGAFETTLLELTAAYASLANHGVRVEPHLVERVLERDGTLLEQVDPEVHEALSPQTAYLMTQLLRGVITNGTGRGAAGIPYALAGKTGTTDDYTDAWFVGYASNLALGVWVGYDEPRELGEKETGARAALPIWRAFMSEALPLDPPADFERPARITVIPVDRRTGLRVDPSAYCRPVLNEVFLEGTEPSGRCSVFAHQRKHLPYALQRYPLDGDGRLVVPVHELELLLQADAGLRLAEGGQRLEFFGPQQAVGIPLRIDYVVEPPEPTGEDPRLAEMEWETWVGQDERPVTIVWIDGRGEDRRTGG